MKKPYLAKPNLMVPWYLMAAYTYYHLDESLMPDADFDTLAKRLLANYDKVEHRHKHLITVDELRGGTLLLPLDKYPEITKDSAVRLLPRKKVRENNHL